jgi:biopolymer transport protein ExbB/TolQ
MLMQLFRDGGFMMYPLTASAVLALALATRSAVRLFAAEAHPEPQLKAAIDGVLFWGSFALIIGVLGTVIGVFVSAQAVERAGEVAPSLVWGGIKVSLITTAYGMLILSAASLAWFGLRLLYQKLEAPSAQ